MGFIEMMPACLQVLRRVAAENAAALAPHLSEVVPLVTALASGGAGPTRLAAERALTASLRLNVDIAIAQVRSPTNVLTRDSFARRAPRPSAPLPPSCARMSAPPLHRCVGCQAARHHNCAWLWPLLIHVAASSQMWLPAAAAGGVCAPGRGLASAAPAAAATGCLELWLQQLCRLSRWRPAHVQMSRLRPRSL